MFSYTTLCLVLLRTGKLYSWCNSVNNVYETFNKAYRGLFLTFAFRYISESHDIKTINVLGQEVEKESIRVGLPASINEFIELSDAEGKVIMEDASKLAQKKRIQKL